MNGTWYMVYRNYKSDPIFGGTDKCVTCTETGPVENGVVPVHYTFDSGEA